MLNSEDYEPLLSVAFVDGESVFASNSTTSLQQRQTYELNDAE
jgi:hypothetical protein